MCDTYDAIYEIKKMTNKDKLTIWMDNAKIKGTLAHCDCGCDGKCLKGVVTLKDAKTHCKKTGEEVDIKWISIPSMWIKAFAFED